MHLQRYFDKIDATELLPLDERKKKERKEGETCNEVILEKNPLETKTETTNKPPNSQLFL